MKIIEEARIIYSIKERFKCEYRVLNSLYYFLNVYVYGNFNFPMPYKWKSNTLKYKNFEYAYKNMGQLDSGIKIYPLYILFLKKVNSFLETIKEKDLLMKVHFVYNYHNGDRKKEIDFIESQLPDSKKSEIKRCITFLKKEKIFNKITTVDFMERDINLIRNEL